jgi:hypothetical protein
MMCLILLLVAADSLTEYGLPSVHVGAPRYERPTNPDHPWDVIPPSVTERLLEAEAAEPYLFFLGAGGWRRDDELGGATGECLTGERLHALVTALLDTDNYKWSSTVHYVRALQTAPLPGLGIRFTTPLGDVDIQSYSGFLGFQVLYPVRVGVTGLYNPSVLHALAVQQFPAESWPKADLALWQAQ